MEEVELISLRDFFVRLAERDRRWTRQQLVFQMERAEYLLSDPIKGLRFPSEDDDAYLDRGEKAAADLQALLVALRQVKDGVPLDEISVPATFLTEAMVEEPSPYVITKEIGTPLTFLELPTWTHNPLARAGFTTVESVEERLLGEGVDGLLLIRHFGQRCLEETLTALRAKGFLEEEV